MSEQWLVEVGKSETTGKWHARITTSSDVFYSPPCDTEQEATEFREQGLEHIKAAMGNRVMSVVRQN